MGVVAGWSELLPTCPHRICFGDSQPSLRTKLHTRAHPGRSPYQYQIVPIDKRSTPLGFVSHTWKPARQGAQRVDTSWLPDLNPGSTPAAI